MKKIIALILTLCLSSCSGVNSNSNDNNMKNPSDNSQTTIEKKLEGYYKNVFSSSQEVYYFEITDVESGDYGGTMTLTQNTSQVNVWYIVKDTVYINGSSKYTFDGNALYCSPLSERNMGSGVYVTDDSMLTGNMISYSFGSNWNVNFHPNGTIDYRCWKERYDCWGDSEHGTYTIINNVVTIYDVDGSCFARFYLADNELYREALLPI